MKRWHAPSDFNSDIGIIFCGLGSHHGACKQEELLDFHFEANLLHFDVYFLRQLQADCSISVQFGISTLAAVKHFV